MSEIRAPDPTLDALLSSDDEHRVVCSDDTSVRGGAVAHRAFGPLSVRTQVDRCKRTACGLSVTGPGFRVVQARHARWFVVPCRKCFPDAPPPGYSLQDDSCGDGCSYQTWQPDPHLAWQCNT